MDNHEYARQEKLRENLLNHVNHVDAQETCGFHPAAHLWQEAYHSACKDSKSGNAAVSSYLKQHSADSQVQAMLAVGGAGFAITAAVVESPAIIGLATLGAVGCGGAFLWSEANTAMKHMTGKDLGGH